MRFFSLNVSTKSGTTSNRALLQFLEPPGPLPLGVAVIDASIKLFGQVFPHIAQKHRNQLLSHFATCIKNAKAGKAQAVTMNIFTAFLGALRVRQA